MKVRIDKASEVPVCKQLSEQIVFLIATGSLRADDALPSVRQMALRHKIHPNTVSEAYKEQVPRHWLKRHRGKKMVVRPFDDLDHPVEDLDDLIDDTIRTAIQRGYTLQELRKRVRERSLIVPPDHVLIIEDEPGMRRLLRQELSDMLPLLTIEAISPDKLVGNQGPVIGALVVTLPGRVWNLVAGNPSWILASCVSKVWWAFGEQYDPKRAKTGEHGGPKQALPKWTTAIWHASPDVSNAHPLKESDVTICKQLSEQA